MSTEDNLKAAFAGESQANRKYLAFAKEAAADGYTQVARLFRAIAEAETVHAHAHLRAMSGVRSTAENLQAAIAGEKYEVQEMYPDFLAAAEKSGHQAAARSFRHALAVEEVHHQLLTEALKAVQAGSDLPAAPVYVCTICGYTVAGEPPGRCPICSAVASRFSKVD